MTFPRIPNAIPAKPRHRPASRCARVFAGFRVAILLVLTGCGATSSRSKPGALSQLVHAQPLTVAPTAPPVEPPPRSTGIASGTATGQPPAVAQSFGPAPPTMDAVARNDQQFEAIAEEIRGLKESLQQLERRQSLVLEALEKAQSGQQGTHSRIAALEAHLALQSSVVEDLKRSSEAQQSEQWRALDAISESIDRILRGEKETGPGYAAASSTSPQETAEDRGFEFEDEQR